MSLSTILSKLSRLGLLSVFCMGLFLSSGELSMSPAGNVQIGSGGVQSAMAADDATTTKKGVEDPAINTIISVLNLGIGVLTFLVTPLIMLAGWLLSPDWTFGEIFGLRPILHQLWILVSNVVYVIFGFMLVFVAFANIFGGENAKTYEMKTMLPKLVTGMLIVPFTWFIVSAVLSISNILTASVISLPMETILKSGGETSTLLTDKIIPTHIFYVKGSDSGTGSSQGMKNNGEFSASDCTTNPQDCLSIKEFLTNGGGGAYNLLSVYAYGIFRIQGYKAITTEQKINKVIDIASKLGFGIIFFVIFGILVIAIVYALFSRAMMLWLYAMFSPIFALTFVLGDKAKKLEKFTIKEFISLAMVPVYVSAALAFGLMFLGLVMGATGGDKTGNGSLKSDIVDITSPGGITEFKFGGDNGITLTTQGLLDPAVKSGGSKALDLGKGVIGTIIMNVLALVILWMTVMTALGASKITEAAVAPIKGFGDEIGKLAMKAPQYIPIPLPGGKSTSMAGMSTVGTSISQKVNSMAMGDASEIGSTFGKQIGEKLGLKDNGTSQALDKLRQSLSNKDPSKSATIQDKGHDLRNAFSSMGISKELAISDANIRGAMVDAMEKTYGLTGGELNELRKISDSGQFDIKFKELAGTHKGKGLDMLADNKSGVDNDTFSNIFTGKVDTTSNITIHAHPDVTKTDRDLTIEGNSKKFTFDLNLDTKKNAESLKELKGAMKESDLKEALQKCGMKDTDVDNLITELKKTTGFFKS
ncbi:hypothetical protein AUK10_00115 [Candidatus Gracilibacteria bacterium CG2_30_37_12]|nr:MAG: hypothetical protein AUK10_00115 [Candidatus Gracilibacteria bacterium CG2_30_37_12]